MVEEEAKRKALESKLRNIAEKQKLAEQRFRLRMEEMELAKREEYLKCRNELAQVEDRQMVYSSAMKEHYRHEIPSTSNWNPLANEFIPGHPKEQNRNRSFTTVGKFVNSSPAQDVTASTDKHIERETINNIEKDNPVN
ncbi:hypothetical protein LOTGIDRAFT_160043 [Lottia gigantea]|uniref:Uncharacterized protein n=1 Tax=Lottia gigantea TaxID=225164 RepID=V4AMR1_LOTGI|nr:hypothetical protein LOTGIDRAFT_160043 [Lottia gigantea]ESO96060.1 hypothetical protein LOTGIDRAFT_160043 [Lottia gigantea]